MKLIEFLLSLFLINQAIYPQWIQYGLDSTGVIFTGNSFAIDACDNNTAIILHNNHIYKTENTGETWIKIPCPADVEFDVSMIDKDHFWVCADDGKIFATSNGGITWTLQFYDTAATTFMNYIEMFNLDDGIAMGDSRNSLGPAIFIRTTDGGEKWISVNDSAFGGFSGDLWHRIDFIDINKGYFWESGMSPQNLYKTTNSCRNWINTNVPLEHVEIVKFYNEDIGLVASFELYDTVKYQVCRTIDGGNSWETFDVYSKVPQDFEFLPGDPSKVWLVDFHNLFFSSDTGRTWTIQIYNKNLFGRDLIFTDNEHGWLLCDDILFHTSNNGGIFSGVSSNRVLIPSEYSLEQNYPNPFNPSTAISYSIPKYSFVNLTVYDLLGREVQTLINEYKPAGKYHTTFDADGLSSGVYVITLKTGEYKASRKLILLK